MSGKVVDRDDENKLIVYGEWNKFLSAIDIDRDEEIKIIRRKKDAPHHE